MTLRARRLQRTALIAGTLTALTVVGTLTAVPAAAAPIGEPLINMNGSDPHAWQRQLDLGTYNGGYASDPSPYQELTQLWLAYADGDWGTGTNYPCGGISITQLAWSPTQGITGSVNPSANHRVTFTFPGGQPPSWWNGCANNTKPYLEGPALYSFPNADGTRGYDYVLLFAIKPSSTPPECAASNGQPGTANEAIAYATATSLSSLTFQYRGIIVCGSRDSWTNQAAMATFANGRYVLFYHDAGPANPLATRRPTGTARCGPSASTTTPTPARSPTSRSCGHPTSPACAPAGAPDPQRAREAGRASRARAGPCGA